MKEHVPLVDDRIEEEMDNRPLFPKIQAWYAMIWDDAHAKNTKLVISTCLWLLALLVKVLTGGSVTSMTLAGNTMAWLAVAMLIRYEPVRKWVRQYFLWGMALFCTALIGYLCGLITLYYHTQTHVAWLYALSLVLFAILTVLLLIGYVLMNRKQPLVIRIFASLNALALSAVAATSVTLCIATAGRGLVMMIGMFLLYGSIVRFGAKSIGAAQPQKQADSLVWALYTAGQFLFLIGIGLMSGGA